MKDRIAHLEQLLSEAHLKAAAAEERERLATDRESQETIRANTADARALHTEQRALFDLAASASSRNQAEAELRSCTEELSHKQHQMKMMRQEMSQLQLDAKVLTTDLDKARTELDQILTTNHHHRMLSEERGRELAALKASLSWRATEPLRNLTLLIVKLMRRMRVTIQTDGRSNEHGETSQWAEPGYAQHMTSRARQIYTDLKSLIRRR
jgi:chromosome segregation ATPase